MVRWVWLAIAATLFTAIFSVEVAAHWFAAVEHADLVENAATPGLGLPSLALVDGMLLLGVALMVLGELLPRTLGTVGGAVVLVGGIVAIIVGVVMALAAFAKLMLMLGLLLAAPFGTIAYMALFAQFERTVAGATLATLMLLRVLGGVSLIVWSRAVLRAKGLLLLMITGALLSLLVTFLHGLVPAMFVSLTDAIAAIVVCVVAIVWGFVQVVSGVIAILKWIVP